MKQEIREIRESLNLKLNLQSDDIKKYLELNLVNLDSNELLIAGLKSTKTSFELFRDEIDELQQVTITLFKGGFHERGRIFS
jgi:hypothetical protein